MKRQRGFTLIELMIAVAILAILSGLAYPAFQDYTRKSRRSDAAAALGAASLEMEECRSDRATYTGCTPRTATSEGGYYQVVAVVADDGSSYTLTSTPVSGRSQVKDAECTTLTLASSGNRGYSGTASGVTICWRS